MDTDIKTPETDPQHETVGGYFMAWSGHMYWCDSYDPRQGFWMTNVLHPEDRRNVSENAIGRTFHLQHGCVRAHDEHWPGHWYYSVSLDHPEADPQPFASEAARSAIPPRVVVLFDEYDARHFVRNLRKAAQAEPHLAA